MARQTVFKEITIFAAFPSDCDKTVRSYKKLAEGTLCVPLELLLNLPCSIKLTL